MTNNIIDMMMINIKNGSIKFKERFIVENRRKVYSLECVGYRVSLLNAHDGHYGSYKEHH